MGALDWFASAVVLTSFISSLHEIFLNCVFQSSKFICKEDFLVQRVSTLERQADL